MGGCTIAFHENEEMFIGVATASKWPMQDVVVGNVPGAQEINSGTHPTLMSQSMAKASTRCTRLTQMLTGAMFAWLMSNWKCCETNKKERC